MAPRPNDEPQDHQTTIKGAAYTLRFSTKAWAALCQIWELSSVQEAQEKLTTIGDATDIEPVVDVFWAALQRHHPTIDRATAGDLADDMGVPRLAAILPKLLRGSVPADAGGDGKKKPGKPTKRR